MSAPKILIATFGSLGDLHPFVALGQALQREGCRVVVATSADHRALVVREGLDFFDIRPDVAEISAALRTDMGGIARAMSRDDAFLFEKVIFPHLRVAYDQFYEASEGASLIVAHGIAFSAHAVAEKRGLPLAIVVLSPALLYSAYDPLAAAPFVVAPKWALARAYNRFVQDALAEILFLWAKPLRRFRRELGLPKRGGFDLFRGAAPWASTLALCSPLLAPPQPDHAAETLVAGHSFFDRGAVDAERIAALETFLQSGAPPIVFSLGSFVVHAGADFYRRAMRAAESLGERAVMLVEERDLAALAREAPPEIFVAAYAPHSMLFPRAKINVHHGGIGACGQALRAGRPQLVAPFLGDQPDNAARLARLGVARTLPGRKATAQSLARELKALRDAPRYAERARALAPIVAQEDGAAVAARRIMERLETA
jgi:UDP:flavonoid glycosyltransferase YjiC (YdhE family)